MMPWHGNDPLVLVIYAGIRIRRWLVLVWWAALYVCAIAFVVMVLEVRHRNLRAGVRGYHKVRAP